jgi:predicted homoserine dehydrogenase-like protein
MIIIDKALQKRASENNPIRVAMVGAGFMARGIALQICNYVPGMELVAIANRTLDTAHRAYREAGRDSVSVDSVSQLEAAISRGQYAVTDNPLLVCEAGNVDAVIEVTGAVEYGARVVMHAIKHGKHVILMNAEVDGTIGSILKHYADKAGVVYTVADGDQPGVIMNLYRFVKGIGVKPVLCGNIKGLHDPYRNPTTQKGFAEKWGQNPSMVTSLPTAPRFPTNRPALPTPPACGWDSAACSARPCPAARPSRKPWASTRWKPCSKARAWWIT